MPIPRTQPRTAPAEKKAGLAYWAARVLEECDKAGQDFAADPVHDLRVAIRRCRSMADGFLTVDPDPEWKQMKKLGKALFSSLGDLRDAQVMSEWVTRLSEEGDPVRKSLLDTLSQREIALKETAQGELRTFDRKRWSSLNAKLARRTGKVPLEGLVFQHLALERYLEAHALHHRALRNRSQVGYHQLRIGLKRFRYTVENFLPQRHEKWAKDLRDLQDALGEVHDLDVLRAMARTQPGLPVDDCERWQRRIAQERQQRLDFYRQKMLGRDSLWNVWRSELPSGAELEEAAMEKLRVWASFLDPDARHTSLVTRMALQLYDGLAEQGMLTGPPEYRRILAAAALLHEVGRAHGANGHRKRTYRMIRKLTPPLGWNFEEWQCVAVVAHYHRGALPLITDSYFVGLDAKRRTELLPVAGILRLADALDFSHQQRIPRISVERHDEMIVVYGQGLDGISREGERLARARYLLEASCELPIMIRPLSAKSPASSRSLERHQPAATGS